MSIRWKILAGFLILSSMLAIAGAWSIYELSQIGAGTQSLLDDNYRSIEAGAEMIEALERQDSGVLMLLLGRWEQGRALIDEADGEFEEHLDFAESNLTLSGEAERLRAIRESYEAYKTLWERPIVDTERQGSLDWYFDDVHPAFLDAKLAVDGLIQMNSQSMHEAASMLKRRSRRSIMPGAIAILAALLFSLMFSFLLQTFIVQPIVRLNQAVRSAVERKVPFAVSIDTGDELEELTESVRILCAGSRRGGD